MSPAYKPELVEERFWSKVEKSDAPDGCWIWIGATSRGGAGSVSIRQRRFTAMHVAWVLAHGDVTDGFYVRRACRTAVCVRPSHLYLAAKRGPNERLPEERFWAKVNKDGPLPDACPELGPCWLWMARRDKFGYGRIGLSANQVELAHRFSLSLHLGHPLGRQQALHRCDNPSCVNPGHLFLGTHADNMADAKRKGRNARRERQGRAKLTLADVEVIRRLHDQARVTQADLARSFGVGISTINGIVHRQSWV